MEQSSLTDNRPMTEDETVDVISLKKLVEQTGIVREDFDGSMLFEPQDINGYLNAVGCYVYRVIGCKERNEAILRMLKSGSIAPLIEQYLLSISDASGHIAIARKELLDKLNCSRSTLWRGIKMLEDVGSIKIANRKSDIPIIDITFNPNWFKFRKADEQDD